MTTNPSDEESESLLKKTNPLPGRNPNPPEEEVPQEIWRFESRSIGGASPTSSFGRSTPGLLKE